MVDIENIVKKCLKNIVTELLKKEGSFESAIASLELRCDNMFKSIEKNEEDLSLFSRVHLGIIDINSDKIDKRMKYMLFYIKVSKEHIESLKWLLKNKNKFNFDKVKLYNLSLLKEKLSKKNSIFLPF